VGCCHAFVTSFSLNKMAQSSHALAQTQPLVSLRSTSNHQDHQNHAACRPREALSPSTAWRHTRNSTKVCFTFNATRHNLPRSLSSPLDTRCVSMTRGPLQDISFSFSLPLATRGISLARLSPPNTIFLPNSPGSFPPFLECLSPPFATPERLSRTYSPLKRLK
jgi:hypothetical protein